MHLNPLNNIFAGSNSIVGEVIKYGGKSMCEMIPFRCYSHIHVVWNNQHVFGYWRKGLIVSLFQKWNRKDPVNCRGITLMNVTGKRYSRVANNHFVKHLELNNKLYKEQGNFKIGTPCVDN